MDAFSSKKVAFVNCPLPFGRGNGGRLLKTNTLSYLLKIFANIKKVLLL
ncbi:hypothetical protein HMPREF9073_00631 [Capnocytophaga sp. oral taxon 326 str. F0382]|nr:hypothetical protein HMPREF9073_00631 [Capnocytophaga sp. oral taxon 326 str. F0382]